MKNVANQSLSVSQVKSDLKIVSLGFNNQSLFFK